MFAPTPPHEQVMRKLEQLELHLAEANLAIVEIRKVQLQQQATIATLLGDTAQVSLLATASSTCLFSDNLDGH
jgi:hypothetical protein